MRLVVVTGAGASRELGEEGPLPLMSHWSDRLCEELDRDNPGLADAAGLTPGLSGEEFEAALGALLRWQELRPLNERFFKLGGKNVGKHATEVVHAFERETARLHTIMATLNTSLYSEFGADRISVEAARGAYRWILEEVGGGTRPIFVTTNYDCSIEIGLQELGFEPNTGFIRRQGRSPKLAAEGMTARVENAEDEIAVLHLHGAVGWYQQGDEVIEFYADQPYNDTQGVPSVLYPDPDKDPTRDAAVQMLWDEFDQALEGATHVLVIGHSLHDRALVERLNNVSASVGVCVHSQDDGLHQTEDQLEGVRSVLPEAISIPTRFGPEPAASPKRIAKWASGAPVKS